MIQYKNKLNSTSNQKYVFDDVYFSAIETIAK